MSGVISAINYKKILDNGFNILEHMKVARYNCYAIMEFQTQHKSHKNVDYLASSKLPS